MTEKIQRWKTAFPGSSSPKISMISSPPRNREIGPFVMTGIAQTPSELKQNFCRNCNSFIDRENNQVPEYFHVGLVEAVDLRHPYRGLTQFCPVSAH